MEVNLDALMRIYKAGFSHGKGVGSFDDKIKEITALIKDFDIVIYAGRLEGFLKFMGEHAQDSVTAEKIVSPNIYLKSIKEFDFSIRIINCLFAENIEYMGDLVQWAEWRLLRTPNLGKQSMREIKEVLDKCGLKLDTPFETLNIDELPKKNWFWQVD